MEKPSNSETGLDRRTAIGVIVGSVALAAGAVEICKALEIPKNTMAEDVLDKSDLRESQLLQEILQK